MKKYIQASRVVGSVIVSNRGRATNREALPHHQMDVSRHEFLDTFRDLCRQRQRHRLQNADASAC